MMSEIDLSGIIKPVQEIPDEGKTLLPHLEQCVQSVSSLLNGYCYILDYGRCRILPSAGHSSFMDTIFGVKGMRINKDTLSRAIDKKELERIRHCIRSKNAFMATLPMEMRMELVFHMDICVKSAGGFSQTLHLRCQPLSLNRNGTPWLEVHTLSFSPRRDSGRLILSCKKENSCYVYDAETELWCKKERPRFSIQERQVLSLISQGRSELEISDFLCRSVVCIKKAKKTIFDKLDVKSSIEATQMAQNLSII